MTVYYVTAKLGHRTNYLCGPFDTMRRASRMIEPVRLAALRWRPDGFQGAIFGVSRTRDRGAGSLPLDWINPLDVIEASRCRMN